jgi:hypothetical protein
VVLFPLYRNPYREESCGQERISVSLYVFSEAEEFRTMRKHLQGCGWLVAISAWNNTITMGMRKKAPQNLESYYNSLIIGMHETSSASLHGHYCKLLQQWKINKNLWRDLCMSQKTKELYCHDL